eukprot:SAG25_NODE_467_length_7729_cov_268.210457_3_plen_61_part_00
MAQDEDALVERLLAGDEVLSRLAHAYAGVTTAPPARSEMSGGSAGLARAARQLKRYLGRL